MSKIEKALFGTKYLRMGQGKFVEVALPQIPRNFQKNSSDMICLSRPYLQIF